MMNGEKRIAPVIALSILILFSIGLDVAMFVGMLYLFEGQNEEEIRDRERDIVAQSRGIRDRAIIIENQNETNEGIALQIERGNTFRNQTFQAQNALLTEINETVTEVLEHDANLTREEQEGLINNIKAIPERLEQIINQTAEPQSNFTAQRIATDRIDYINTTVTNITQNVEENNQKIAQILELLQNPG